MTEFINTVDVIGDDALTDSIINRTVSEFCSDAITKIYWHRLGYCKQLVRVDCPNVTTIDSYAFNGCEKLVTANFPEATVFGQHIFNSCKSLKTVNMPKMKQISDSTFYRCLGLETISLPAVTSVGSRAFYQCTSLASLNAPYLTQATGYSAFYECTNLTTVILPSLKTLRGSDFGYCEKLKMADLGMVGNIPNNTFQSCGALETLILRKNDSICTQTGNLFGTRIANGTGYVYVPRALLSDDDATKDYRRATNWSNYAAQFRALEDYTVDGTTTGALDETKIAA